MKRTAIFLALAVLFLLTSVAMADSGADYDLSWWTVNGGGYTFSTGRNYALGGTVGQLDAGVLMGNGYTLVGGFWGGAVAEYRFYLPLVLRQYP
jgi:hypothetical protein